MINKYIIYSKITTVVISKFSLAHYLIFETNCICLSFRLLINSENNFKFQHWYLRS